MKLKRQYLFQVAIDIILINLASFLALVLRFDGIIPVDYLESWVLIVTSITLVRLGIFSWFRLYQSLWRYSSIPEFFLVIKAATVSSGVLWLLVLVAQQLAILPFVASKALLVIDWLMTILVLGSMRFTLRLRREWYHQRQKHSKECLVEPRKNLLIVGAGEAGSVIIREIFKELRHQYQPVGFIDDDPAKQGKRLHGVPIIGTRKDLIWAIEAHQIEELIIAMPAAPKAEIKKIIELCQTKKVHIKITPAVAEIISGKVILKQLREVAIEDLLGREPVKLDLDDVAGYLKGEEVLITGAGGSIGSELCRQIAKFQPQTLILLGRGENSIYEITQELAATYPELNQIPVIADIRDRRKLGKVFAKYRPTVVFHAAAHKHVPLMEAAPDEAIKNNVFGTKNLAELSDEYRCKRFVLISTDKAVNPTSVMGATKRVAELVIQDLNARSQTKFMAVRFGNVLGSRGSVVPLFRKQIAGGGPITITHPEMTRFFMTIPEAVQLVIQAGALGGGGEIFVLDMGKPVKIVDLAKELIRLSGLVVEKDIKIEFTGIRPGEKLYEEIFTSEEGHQSTKHQRIFISSLPKPEHSVLARGLTLLWEWLNGDAEQLVIILRDLIPRYQPERVKGKETVIKTDNFEVLSPDVSSYATRG